MSDGRQRPENTNANKGHLIGVEHANLKGIWCESWERLANMTVPANTVLEAWHFQNTPYGTWVKMSQNIRRCQFEHWPLIYCLNYKWCNKCNFVSWHWSAKNKVHSLGLRTCRTQRQSTPTSLLACIVFDPCLFCFTQAACNDSHNLKCLVYCCVECYN